MREPGPKNAAWIQDFRPKMQGIFLSFISVQLIFRYLIVFYAADGVAIIRHAAI
jgi:hypothetical protein